MTAVQEVSIHLPFLRPQAYHGGSMTDAYEAREHAGDRRCLLLHPSMPRLVEAFFQVRMVGALHVHTFALLFLASSLHPSCLLIFLSLHLLVQASCWDPASYDNLERCMQRALHATAVLRQDASMHDSLPPRSPAADEFMVRGMGSPRRLEAQRVAPHAVLYLVLLLGGLQASWLRFIQSQCWSTICVSCTASAVRHLCTCTCCLAFQDVNLELGMEPGSSLH